MSMRFFLLFAVFMVSIGCGRPGSNTDAVPPIATLPPMQGHIIGNGSGLIKEPHVLFMQEPGEIKTIHYCTESTPTFDSFDLPSLVEQTFSIWETYYREHREFDVLTKIGFYKDYEPVFSSKFLGKCSEERNLENADLVIHFGNPPKFLAPQQVDTLNGVLGYVSETSYDFSIGFGKAVLWISSPENFRNSTFDPKLITYPTDVLQSLMLHLFGYIYGVANVPGTIMDINFTHNLLKASVDPNADILLTIDGTRELIMTPLHSDQFITRGTVTYEGEKLSGTLKFREAIDQISLDLSLENQSKLPPLVLKVAELPRYPLLNPSGEPLRIFNKIYGDPTKPDSSFFKSFTQEFKGTTEVNGQKLNFTFQRNEVGTITSGFQGKLQ